MKKNPLNSSKSIFQEAGVTITNSATRNNILNQLATVVKIQSSLFLSKGNIKKRISSSNTCMKYDFSSVLFPNECRTTLDGPEAFARGWLSENSVFAIGFRRQQDGGGVLF